MTREEVLEAMQALLPAQFETLRSRLGVPQAYLYGAQAERAVQILEYFEQPNRNINTIGEMLNQVLASKNIILNTTVVVLYSPEDSEIVIPLTKLIKTAGTNVFLDIDAFRYGEKRQDKMQQAMNQAGRLLLFWSHNSADSDRIDKYWRAAHK